MPDSDKIRIETAVFGGGCFWCTEAIFKMLRGVISAEPGYAGGQIVNPTHEDVSSGRTGHAEATRNCELVTNPKLEKVQEKFKNLLATNTK